MKLHAHELLGLIITTFRYRTGEENPTINYEQRKQLGCNHENRNLFENGLIEFIPTLRAQKTLQTAFTFVITALRNSYRCMMLFMCMKGEVFLFSFQNMHACLVRAQRYLCDFSTILIKHIRTMINGEGIPRGKMTLLTTTVRNNDCSILQQQTLMDGAIKCGI